MRPRRSTVVVFVVVAAAWFLAWFIALAYVMSFSLIGGLRLPGVVVRALDALLQLVAASFWPILVLSHGTTALGMEQTRFAGIVDYIVAAAISSHFWAVVIASLFVLVRDLRERRAAPREA